MQNQDQFHDLTLPAFVCSTQYSVHLTLIEVLQMKQAVLKTQPIGQARRARPIG